MSRGDSIRKTAWIARCVARAVTAPGIQQLLGTTQGRVHSQPMRRNELLQWLAELPREVRDQAVEQYLGIAGPMPDHAPPGPDLIGYHASSVAAVVQALVLAAVQPEDVLIDLGAGLGKVALLAHLLTGAHARGIELQPTLVEGARASATRFGADVMFSQGDVRRADLDAGTVFYLYAPFTGPVLAEVLARLFSVASKHAIVVCALGVDLHRTAPWLAPRPSDSFWLTVYDSVVSGVAPRAPRISRLRRSLSDIVALER
jgi:hypothetical protein